MAAIATLRTAIAGLGTRVLDVALPARCAGCGLEGPALCAACAPALDIRLHADPGVPIGLPADLPAPLVQLEWCAPFSGVTRQALHALKYDGERRLAGPLGAAVARRWARAGAGGEVLVPVPASPDRVRDRGYDQAALLAVAAGRRLGLPVVTALERTRATRAQFDLDRAARATNLGGAFRVRASQARASAGQAGGGGATTPGPAASSAVAGRWVVLVDDVVTTGSTLAECAVVLLDAGALAVAAITVARER